MIADLTVSWMDRHRHLLLSWWLYSVVVLGTFACSKPSRSGGGQFRVALITPGSITDAAWNSGAYAGLLAVRDSLGASISNVEARTPAEQEDALRTYAEQGFDLIFAHGYEFQAPAERVSAQFPHPVFVVTSGERAHGRVVPLVFRLEEASYLAGMVAGGMTRSGIIGFVGGVELPPVKQAYQGWVNGAKSVNPSVQSRSTYLNTWDDPAAGHEAAIALIRAGVDMFHHNADAAALGVFQAVKETGTAYVFGANGDQAHLAPERVLGSAVIDLPRAFMLVTREVQGGHFQSRVESFGVSSDVVKYVPNPLLTKLVPDSLKARVEAAEAKLRSGTLKAVP
jgi:basic membrane protein A and related proteins